MLFKRFLSRRRAAPESSQPPAKTKGADALRDQALRHPDPSKRRAALTQLSDPLTIAESLRQDSDHEVRACARAALGRVLCEAELSDYPADALTDLVSEIHDDGVMEQIARQSPRPEVRRSALERARGERALVECAIEDRLAANRAFAAARIEDKAALDEVVRRIGKRDKNVLRIVREKLRRIAEAEERPRLIRAQCEDICAKLERLGRLGSWAQDRALLEHLERQWSELAPEAEPAWRTRFEQERSRFLAAFEAYARENAALLAEQAALASTRAEAQALIEALERLDTAGVEASEIQAELDRIDAAWKALPAMQASAHGALGKTYDRQVAAIRQALQTQSAREHQRDRAAKLAVRAEHLLAESKALDHKRVNALLEDSRTLIAQLPEPEDRGHLQDLVEQLESRLLHQRKHAEQKLQQLAERLEALEAHIAAGELRKADPLYQSIRANLDLIRASGARQGGEAQIANRLRKIAPRLRELQTWRRWGADQHREELCLSMERLQDQELTDEALADQLRALQADWKGLDRTGSPANQALWERFHQASEIVYERCRHFLDRQTAEREANRAARERVCEQLEEFLTKVDWDRVDWKRILRAEREMRQAWAAIGPTEGRQRKPLERRFHQSLRQLDQRLDAERKVNQQLKRDLIAQVQALSDNPDLDAAIEQAKVIQRQWHTTVPARHKDENKLWQSFRAACDAVFERRAAVQQAHASELQENLDARQAICDEALRKATEERDPKRLAAAQRELTERWRAAEPLPVPRQSAAQLAQSWRASRTALEGARRRSEDRAREASLALLKRQAALCEQLERELLEGPSVAIDQASLQSAWSALEVQGDDALQAAIRARFDRALEAARDPDKRAALRGTREENAARLSQLCLQLEIIAGLESPPELAQERLELQVARLAERMSDGEEDPLHGAARRLFDWYLSGPVTDGDALAQRFARIEAALMSPCDAETASA